MGMKNTRQAKLSPLYVCKPALPERGVFDGYVSDIFSSAQLTNNGPLAHQLEDELIKYLGVSNCSLVNNGTFALQAAMAIFDLKGEVITSPFSFVATAHAIHGAGLTPRFVDVDPETLCIDPACLEEHINDKTCAILGVHVYGRACDTDALAHIASQNNLKLIYDAAHCFGIEHKGRSLLSYGDASAISFHATKSFHTIEGGAVICGDDHDGEKIKRYRNFGLDDHNIQAEQDGLNGKMNEFQAAMGLANLECYEAMHQKRRDLFNRYKQALSGIEGLDFVEPESEAPGNYGYCPVLIGDAYPLARDELMDKMQEFGIYPRRYFYPLITDMLAFKPYKGEFPHAEKAAKQVLCLPLYPDLAEADQDRVIDIMSTMARGG